jgi:hypothetical protein
MSTGAVATLAGRNFIFDPRGTTFDTWDDVFGCRPPATNLNLLPAPDTFVAIALENKRETIAAAELSPKMGIRHVTQF